MSSRARALIKPRGLKRAARLAVLSPASTPRRERVEAGMKRLAELGYQPVLSPSALGGGPLYYAGAREQRAAELMAAFADPEIDGIICTRGGWGSAELLPLLDAEVVRRNPKPFIGYSDHTSLHLWLGQTCGMVSFHGPMVAADFARSDGVDEASWASTFTGHASWALGRSDGLRVLRAGVAEGPLTGGCLAIYIEAVGTRYAPEPADRGEGRILFLEDIGTKPYQWDRMLLHLSYAGLLENVSGIVFGDMEQCANESEQYLLERAILHRLADFEGPIAIGLRSGHVSGRNITLPLGVQVRLDLRDSVGARLEFLEAAVSG